MEHGGSGEDWGSSVWLQDKEVMRDSARKAASDQIHTSIFKMWSSVDMVLPSIDR